MQKQVQITSTLAPNLAQYIIVQEHSSISRLVALSALHVQVVHSFRSWSLQVCPVTACIPACINLFSIPFFRTMWPRNLIFLSAILFLNIKTDLILSNTNLFVFLSTHSRHYYYYTAFLSHYCSHESSNSKAHAHINKN